MREVKNGTKKPENETRIRGWLKKQAFWKGSYTVEAALVFPIILFVLAALLILAFYVHDRGILQGLACETAVAGSNYIMENERKAAAEQVRKQAGQERLMGSRSSQGHVAFGSSEVYARYTAVCPVPGMVMRYLSGNQLKISKSWQVYTLNPSEWIRKKRGIVRSRDGGSR